MTLIAPNKSNVNQFPIHEFISGGGGMPAHVDYNNYSPALSIKSLEDLYKDYFLQKTKVDCPYDQFSVTVH